MEPVPKYVFRVPKSLTVESSEIFDNLSVIDFIQVGGDITASGNVIADTFIGTSSAVDNLTVGGTPIGTLIQNTTVNDSISSSYAVTASYVLGGSFDSASYSFFAETASYVEYNNVVNKPSLVSGSSQIDYNLIQNVPSNIVSGSPQINYNLIQNTPNLPDTASEIYNDSSVIGNTVKEALDELNDNTFKTEVIFKKYLKNVSDTLSEISGSGNVISDGNGIDFMREGIPTGNVYSWVAIQFDNLNVEKDCDIISCSLQFTADSGEDNTGPIAVEIFGELTGSSSDLTTTPFSISSRTKTTSSVIWNIPEWADNAKDSTTLTPDLSGIVNEITSQPDFVDGSNITFLITYTGSSVPTDYRVARTPSENYPLELNVIKKGASSQLLVSNTGQSVGKDIIIGPTDDYELKFIRQDKILFSSDSDYDFIVNPDNNSDTSFRANVGNGLAFLLNAVTNEIFMYRDLTVSASVSITGSEFIYNNSPVIISNQTSSMTVLSASYAETASFALNIPTIDTGSLINQNQTSSMTVLSASYAETASFAETFGALTTLIENDSINPTNIYYVGKAKPGSVSNQAVWRISKVTKVSSSLSRTIEFADSNFNFDNIFDNRESLSYG